MTNYTDEEIKDKIFTIIDQYISVEDVEKIDKECLLNIIKILLKENCVHYLDDCKLIYDVISEYPNNLTLSIVKRVLNYECMKYLKNSDKDKINLVNDILNDSRINYYENNSNRLVRLKSLYNIVGDDIESWLKYRTAIYFLAIDKLNNYQDNDRKFISEMLYDIGFFSPAMYNRLLSKLTDEECKKLFSQDKDNLIINSDQNDRFYIMDEENSFESHENFIKDKIAFIICEYVKIEVLQEINEIHLHYIIKQIIKEDAMPKINYVKKIYNEINLYKNSITPKILKKVISYEFDLYLNTCEGSKLMLIDEILCNESCNVFDRYISRVLKLNGLYSVATMIPEVWYEYRSMIRYSVTDKINYSSKGNLMFIESLLSDISKFSPVLYNKIIKEIPEEQFITLFGKNKQYLEELPNDKYYLPDSDDTLSITGHKKIDLDKAINIAIAGISTITTLYFTIKGENPISVINNISIPIKGLLNDNYDSEDLKKCSIELLQYFTSVSICIASYNKLYKNTFMSDEDNYDEEKKLIL